MHDNFQYLNVEKFGGHRFVESQRSGIASSSDNAMRCFICTDASKDSPIWALDSKVWYVDESFSIAT